MTKKSCSRQIIHKFINLKTDRVIRMKACDKEHALKKLKDKGIDDVMYLRKKKTKR